MSCFNFSTPICVFFLAGPCSFEEDMCGYSDVSIGKYEWVRGDPSWDHTNAPEVDNSGSKTGNS